jgi:hypothetical protein
MEWVKAGSVWNEEWTAGGGGGHAKPRKQGTKMEAPRNKTTAR